MSEPTEPASELTECDCFLYDEDPDTGGCYCGHAIEEHELAPGGHPGACEATTDV